MGDDSCAITMLTVALVSFPPLAGRPADGLRSSTTADLEDGQPYGRCWCPCSGDSTTPTSPPSLACYSSRRRAQRHQTADVPNQRRKVVRRAPKYLRQISDSERFNGNRPGGGGAVSISGAFLLLWTSLCGPNQPAFLPRCTSTAAIILPAPPDRHKPWHWQRPSHRLPKTPCRRGNGGIIRCGFSGNQPRQPYHRQQTSAA
jgi:hypothetical protein